MSGQAPNVATQRDCRKFTEFVLTKPALDANGQALGSGCVYPAIVPMLGDQLEAAGKSWRGHMQDLGNDKSKEVEECGHPPIGADDPTTNRTPADQYATKHNPFYYFHSFIDNHDRCAQHVVNLRHLEDDLKSAATTPNYSFITPNLCDDGHDAPCVDHAPGGLVQADGFLRKWVPKIMDSPAYKADGVLIITFDEASGPPGQDSSACCGEMGAARIIHPARRQRARWWSRGRRRALATGEAGTRPTCRTTTTRHFAGWKINSASRILGYAAANGLVTFGAGCVRLEVTRATPASFLRLELRLIRCDELANLVGHVEQLRPLLLVERHGKAAEPVDRKAAFLADLSSRLHARRPA